MVLKDISSIEDFRKGITSSSGAAVYFWATWCEPCSHMDLVFRQLATESPDQTFLRVDADELSDLTEEFNVTAIPHFIFFQNGVVVDALEGANPPELAHKVSRHVASLSSSRTSNGPAPSFSGASAAPVVLESVLAGARGISSRNSGSPAQSVNISTKEPLPPEATNGANDLNSRLKALTNSKPIMLFMKGNPKEPKCGFSSKVVNVLESLQLRYETFDILSDTQVREGLKKYSNWPTYPQLYYKGELIGGCDIVLEMHRSGELRKLFQDQLSSQTEEETLNERLSRLIKSSDIMLFQKGTPEEPRCGFSRRVVNVLNEIGVKFGSFDILTNEEIRQGLKEYSNWPTYPQLYYKGEFIGGCDIVLDMHNNGELKQVLTQQ